MQSGLSGIETTEIAIAANGPMYTATANVHKSTDNSVSWFVSSPLLYASLDLDIKSNGFIFLTNFNGIYRSTDEGNSWQLIYGPTTFNPVTIKFYIPAAANQKLSKVRLVIYDITGKEVETLVDQTLHPEFI